MADADNQPPPSQPANNIPEPLKELADRLAPQLEEAQARLEAANEHVKTFIKKNPGSVLLGAAAVGFLIGRWASRR